MEKLQKALERAREQRARALPAEGDATDPIATASPSAAMPADPSEIVYRQTRIVQTREKDLREQRVVAGLFREELSDTFRILRAQVLATLKAEAHTTLAITSPNTSEGKSLTAINLATSIALDPKYTVLLVDSDLRRPRLHAYLGIQPTYGLCDYLLGNVPLHECLVNPGVPRLVLLAAGEPQPQSTELLSSAKMADLAHELKKRYPERIVIYDLPPVLATGDALVLLPHVEATLLVLEEGRTRKTDLKRSLELLTGFNVIGTVLNKSSQRQTAYH